jgi:hypothetical protein
VATRAGRSGGRPFSSRPDGYPEVVPSDGREMTVIDKRDQATKGVWWMSWHREATKDVVACDMLRGAGKRATIRRFLNAETRRGDPPSPAAECIGRQERTQGTETSKYLEEKRKKFIPSVAASEIGRAQTGIRPGVAGALS